MIATDLFLPLARAVARQEGLDSMAVVTIAHPIGGVEPHELDERLAAAVDRVAEALLSSPEEVQTVSAPAVHDAPGDVLEFLHFAEGRRWSDGLPLVPPTEALVARAVAATGRDTGEVLGLVPPSNRGATVGAVAANAVMAGCPAELTPVVVAAVEAALTPRFNLQALTTTTHPVTPLVVVHGPVVEQLGFNSGPNVFGQGNRANAGVAGRCGWCCRTSGRRGRARPTGPPTAPRASTPTASPRTQRPARSAPSTRDRGGGAPGAVTVFGGEGPHNINDHGSTDAAGMLNTIAGALANIGHNNFYLRGQMLLVLGPEHAEVLAREGYDRRRIQEAVHAHPRARASLAGISEGNLDRYRRTAPHVFQGVPADGIVPMLDGPESLLVMVAGGPGKHSMLVPTFGTTEAVTVDVRTNPGGVRDG